MGLEAAVQAVEEARARRAAAMRDESSRVWGHPGAVTSVRPLTLREELALAAPLLRVPAAKKSGLKAELTMMVPIPAWLLFLIAAAVVYDWIADEQWWMFGALAALFVLVQFAKIDRERYEAETLLAKFEAWRRSRGV